MTKSGRLSNTLLEIPWTFEVVFFENPYLQA